MTTSSHELLVQIESAPPAELRATFTSLVQTARAEALQLLDLLLEDDDALTGRMPAIEMLITLLATDEVDGRRRVVRDPASLTPRLAEISAREASGPTSELSDAARQLTSAASNDAEGPLLQQVIHAIRALETSLGSRLLAPRVLKAAVAYSAAHWHRLDDDVRASDAPAADPGDASPTPPAPTAEHQPDARAGAVHQSDAPSTSTDSSRAWPPTRTYAPREIVHEEAPQRPWYRGWILPVSGLAAACAVAAGLFVTRDRGTLFTYSDAQLRGLSPMLVSAYRDQQGQGPLFVGRLAESWHDLDPIGRERACHEIVDRLRRQGVQDAMIYDANFRLEAQYKNGTLRSYQTARR